MEPTQQSGGQGNPGAVLREGVLAATAAPSVHNTQPWLFQLRDDGVDVFVDRRRQLRTLDPDGREMYVSVGLDPEQLATRGVEPSSMSLLGLVRHMADVERGWFREVMAGQDVTGHYESKANRDAALDDAVGDADVVAEAWRLWRKEIAFAEQFVAAAPDVDLVSATDDAWRGPMSLRWVLVHMIEEYARHNGHADLLRERIDGRVGQ